MKGTLEHIKEIVFSYVFMLKIAYSFSLGQALDFLIWLAVVNNSVINTDASYGEHSLGGQGDVHLI